MPQTMYQTQMLFWRQSYQHWISSEIFTFSWWFNIVFLAIVYIAWVKLVDKRKLRDLLLFGSMLAVAAGFVDIIATTIGLWEYKSRLFPLQPATFPFDYTVVPILYMLVLQFTTSWKNYFIGSTLAAAVFSFVISPIYIWVGIKQYHNFNYLYMFILVFSVTTGVKIIYNWIVGIDQAGVHVAESSRAVFQPAFKPLKNEEKDK